jgi:hypothetical protein
LFFALECVGSFKIRVKFCIKFNFTFRRFFRFRPLVIRDAQRNQFDLQI